MNLTRLKIPVSFLMTSLSSPTALIHLHGVLNKHMPMARKKQPGRILKPTEIIGLTRCRVPCHRFPNGNPVRVRANVEFASISQYLKSVPGYKYFQAARGVEDPDEVLLCTYWVDDISLRAFMQSEVYGNYVQTLNLEDETEADSSHSPATTVAELNRQSLPSWDIATIFTAAFTPSTEPDTSKLAHLELLVPYSVYDPPRHSSPLRPAAGWILDPQVEDGRPVKRGIVVQTWAPFEPFEKQLQVYRAVKQDVESREEHRLQLEELHVLSVKEMTWDFGDPNESDESASVPDDEANLVEKVGDLKVQS